MVRIGTIPTIMGDDADGLSALSATQLLWNVQGELAIVGEGGGDIAGRSPSDRKNRLGKVGDGENRWSFQAVQRYRQARGRGDKPGEAPADIFRRPAERAVFQLQIDDVKT